jgi:hypothetical protein
VREHILCCCCCCFPLLPRLLSFTLPMSPRQAQAAAAAALLLLLGALPLVAAHGDEHAADMSAHHAPKPQTHDGRLPSYWSLSEHASLMYWHIAFEILAWVVVLPVGKSPGPYLSKLQTDV